MATTPSGALTVITLSSGSADSCTSKRMWAVGVVCFGGRWSVGGQRFVGAGKTSHARVVRNTPKMLHIFREMASNNVKMMWCNPFGNSNPRDDARCCCG